MATYCSSPPTIHHHHPAYSRFKTQSHTKINILLIRCCNSTNAPAADNTIATSTPTTTPAIRSSRRRRRSIPIQPPPKFDNNNNNSSKAGVDVRSMYQNGDPLGRRDLGKPVVKWISQGMKAMASDFANAEIQGDFSELQQNMGPGLTFVIQSQPYLNAIPMPLGVEAVCFKACTHYPTLFDHFQRELRDLLQDLHSKSLLPTWSQTQSWKLLKNLATSGIHTHSTYLPLL